jgi:hypothetical protein
MDFVPILPIITLKTLPLEAVFQNGLPEIPY